MRKYSVALLFLALTVVAFAGDKKDKEYQTGTIIKVATTDVQSADYKVSDNRVGGMGSGGAFSSAPAHYIRYQALIETDKDAMLVSKDREVTMTPPDLKANTQIKWRPNGNKQVEVIDGHGKKFDMTVVKRFPKETPAATDTPAGSTPAPKQ